MLVSEADIEQKITKCHRIAKLLFKEEVIFDYHNSRWILFQHYGENTVTHCGNRLLHPSSVRQWQKTVSQCVNASECVCLRSISRPCSKQYPFRWDVLIQEEGAQRMKMLSRDGKSLSSSVTLSPTLISSSSSTRGKQKLVSLWPKKPIIFLIIQVLDFVCMCPCVYVSWVSLCGYPSRSMEKPIRSLDLSCEIRSCREEQNIPNAY